ncbi:MAG TPA: hypothetical protein VFW78_08910 [Bacteroidia bacterium]|nr:hypothetical protein [Bacteroidia bacterium]
MRLVGCFLLLLPFAVSAQKRAQPSPPDPVYDSTLVRAGEFYDQENYSEAIELLKAVPANDTTYASATDMLAMTYLSTDSFDLAIQTCETGLSLKSEYKRHFYEMLGAGYDSKDDHQKAMEIFQRGLNEFPSHTRFWYQMGLSCKTAKEYEKAAWYFQQYIRTNPYHSGAHLQLAVIWFNSNQMLPAMLAYQMFLLMDNGSTKSLSVLMSYEKMANGDYMIPKDSIWIKYPKSVDNFDELETIIRSKLALDPAYKTTIKLPYNNVIKTMQVIGEQLHYNKADTGFCMQFYTPFFLDLVQKQQYQSAIYYSFRCINKDEVQKELKKQDAATSKMATAANDYLNKNRQEQWNTLGLSKTQTWFGNNGNLSSEGVFDEATKTRQGPYTFYYDNCMIKSKGTYNKSGNATGKWEYFFPEGGIQAVKYFEEGDLTDSTISYYSDGTILEVLHYQKGLLNGEGRGYYPSGTLRAVFQFAKDERNGKALHYHPNGVKEFETTYANGKINGHYSEYHDNGSISEESDYTNDSYNGPMHVYYPNGKLKSEGMYTNGKAEGLWKYYDEYGNLDMEGMFKGNQQEGQWKEYYSNGVVSSESNFSSGKLTGDASYFDTDGKLWSVLSYSKGLFVKYKYVDKTGKVISSGGDSKGNFEFNSFKPDGKKFKSGKYENGLQTGKHTEWNDFGNISCVQYYKDGELDGVQTKYDKDGTLLSETTWLSGEKDGLYKEYYKTGVIDEQGWYKNGDKRGEWIEYNPDGRPNETNYFQNGKVQGHTLIYDIMGHLHSDVMYNNGEVIRYTGMDTLGNILYSEPIIQGKASFNTLHFNKKPDSELHYANGFFDGEIIRHYSNGQIRYSNVYVHSDKNGPSKRYTYDGIMTESGFYKDGYKDSTLTKYNDDKSLMFKCTYVLGDIEGVRTWYYPNGNPEVVGNYVHGQLEGYNTYYSDNGMVRFRVLYKEGMVQSYSYLNSDSTYLPEIPLPNGSGAVNAKFQNGTPSASFTFHSNWYDGAYKLYYPNGKISVESNFVKNEQEGPSKEYTADGILIKDENYVYDELQGLCKYYSPKGVLLRSSEYYDGLHQGTTKIYDTTGKLIKTIHFYNDEPY